MGYRSNGLIAVRQLQLPDEVNTLSEEEKENLLRLLKSSEFRELGLEILRGIVTDEDVFTEYETYYTCLGILEKSFLLADPVVKGDIIIFNYDGVKWYDGDEDIEDIEGARDELSEITDIHFIRLGEDLEDVECWGELDEHFWIERSIGSDLLNN